MNASESRQNRRWLWKSAALPKFVTVVNERKSFRPSAKPTRPSVSGTHIGNALAMATDMLLIGQDEVARNGAFGNQLRPEVFPDAPLQSPVVSKVHSVPFPGPPPSASCKMRISGKRAEWPFCSLLISHRKLPPEILRREPADPARRCRPAATAWRPRRPSIERRRTTRAPSAPSR